MNKVVIAGMVNLESSVRVPSLPVSFTPILYSSYDINSGVSGGAYNVGKAMSILGDDVRLVSIVGSGKSSWLVKEQLKEDEINDEYISYRLKETPQSVILYDHSGTRQIFCDLKELQEVEYDKKTFLKAIDDVEMVIFQNSNFCRPFLELSRAAGKTIAANVHALNYLHDKYNTDFMKYADILFLSDDLLQTDPYAFIMEIKEQFRNEIIVLGCGEKGALLYVKKDNFIGQFPAVKTREIVNILGAGDALYSAFLHFYQKTGNPYYSIKNAILFSSYKIGTAGSANGFMTEAQLEQYYPIIWK